MLLRIVFAIVIGLLVYGLLRWLATAIPQNLDVLFGIVGAFIGYAEYPRVTPLL